MGRITNGERIRRRRIQIGWTQTDLAKKMNVSQVQISNFETGKIQLHPQERDRIFALLGIGQSDTDDDEVASSADDAPSPFGVWLNKTRIEKRLSVPELATCGSIRASRLQHRVWPDYKSEA